MKIMSISSAQYSKPNFNGLWGEEKSEQLSSSYYDNAHMCEMGTNHVVVTKTYYPFKDETNEDIKKIVKETSKGERFNNNDYYDNSSYQKDVKVKVMPKLDITEGEYNKYRNDDLLSREENRVEDILKINNLKEYLIRNMRRD